jgi:DNA repair protein RecO (recombination protein O)
LAHYHTTEGICLRRLDFSNTSQIAGFLTRDAGRLTFLAKGVTRAPKKGIRTGFDLLGRYEIVYTTRRAGTLHNLTSRWLREDFRGLRDALERVLCGYYAAELVLSFTPEEEPCPGLYDLLARTLRSFAAGQGLGVSVLLLEIGVLAEHGSLPTFDSCAACGRAIPRRGAIAFTPALGGPLCSRCESDQADAVGSRVTPARANLLRTLAELSSRPIGRELARALTPANTLAMSALLRFHMRDLLGRELKMWRYMARREMSRSLRRVRGRGGLRGS